MQICSTFPQKDQKLFLKWQYFFFSWLKGQPKNCDFHKYTEQIGKGPQVFHWANLCWVSNHTYQRKSAILFFYSVGSPHSPMAWVLRITPPKPHKHTQIWEHTETQPCPRGNSRWTVHQKLYETKNIKQRSIMLLWAEWQGCSSLHSKSTTSGRALCWSPLKKWRPDNWALAVAGTEAQQDP